MTTQTATAPVTTDNSAELEAIETLKSAWSDMEMSVALMDSAILAGRNSRVYVMRAIVGLLEFGKFTKKNGAPNQAEIVRALGVNKNKISNYFAGITALKELESAGKFKFVSTGEPSKLELDTVNEKWDELARIAKSARENKSAKAAPVKPTPNESAKETAEGVVEVQQIAKDDDGLSAQTVKGKLRELESTIDLLAKSGAGITLEDYEEFQSMLGEALNKLESITS